MKIWGIKNFKAVVNAELRLDLPLTLIAGANSSGKSSIVQSLLVFAQTVNAHDGVVLNGPLVRLGSASDVIRQGAGFCEFAFETEVDGDAATGVGSVRVEITLEAAARGASLVPAKYRVLDGDGAVLIEATRDRLNRQDEVHAPEPWAARGAVALRLTTVEGVRAPSRMCLVLAGFEPLGLAVHRKRDDVQRAFRRAVDTFAASDRFINGRIPAFILRQALGELTQVLAQNDRGTGAQSSPTAVVARLHEMQPDEVLRAVAEATSLRYADSEYATIAVGSYPVMDSRSGISYAGPVEAEVVARYQRSLALLAAAANEANELARNVAYLGPLREEPRVVQSAWDVRSDGLPVGARGEMTAEVLYRYGESEVHFFDPDGVEREATLREAVGIWCEYLGIGTQIDVNDQNKLGRGLKLVVGGFSRDLTAIGVGASQLLPVIVSLLSTAEDEQRWFLVEQPELHLHPALQARLGDFFAIVRPDVRIVVETHSEALLTRIRRRIAEGADPKATQVLFVEQRLGESDVRPLAFDDFGDLDQWPNGFFDDRISDSRYIAEAIAKRLAGGAVPE